MADILIRGMEMPKTCSQCPMCYDYMMCKLNHFVFWNTNEPFDCCDDRLAGCPLVELPEHGDLIDICNAENAMFALGNYHLNDYKQGWNDGIKAVIENAPVVIPSNKEDVE